VGLPMTVGGYNLQVVDRGGAANFPNELSYTMLIASDS
jgi:hypothetical protein